MRIVDVLFAGLGVVGLWGGYSLFTATSDDPIAEATQPRLPVVEVAAAEVAEVAPSVRQTALLRASSEVPVTSELSGRVVWINDTFQLGQTLEAGEEIFRLDSARLVTDVERASADVTSAEAELDRLQKEIVRVTALAEGNISTRATLATTEANLASAEATLLQRQAALRATEIALRQATITAPFDAVVSQETLSLGQFLQPGTDVGRLVARQQAELLVRLNADQLQAIQAGGDLVGSAATVRATDGSGAEKPGVIQRVALTNEASTQTTAVLIVVENPFSEDGGVFRINSLFEVAIPLRSDNARLLSVPVEAVQTGNRVWTIQDGGLAELSAQIDRRENDRIILQSDDIEPGMPLVTTRLPNAVEGLKVRVVAEAGE